MAGESYGVRVLNLQITSSFEQVLFAGPLCTDICGSDTRSEQEINCARASANQLAVDYDWYAGAVRASC
jgi:hypothetical protein